MAHGKRVLVLAQKEDPLRVVRDGLPDEVKALCLAVRSRHPHPPQGWLTHSAQPAELSALLSV